MCDILVVGAAIPSEERIALVRLLQQGQHRISSVGVIQEAAERIKQQQFDLVVLSNGDLEAVIECVEHHSEQRSWDLPAAQAHKLTEQLHVAVAEASSAVRSLQDDRRPEWQY